MRPEDAGNLVMMLVGVTRGGEQRGWQWLTDALKPPGLQLAAGEGQIEMVPVNTRGA